jgi:tripartite-type tricarboxylate transporter receptor subunit TctC
MRLFLFGLAALALPALAQDYPNKPVRMVVGFPPGGGTDVVARILTPRMTELLGQPVVVDNRPGATGTMAAGQVAKSPPDGYTIMMGHVSVNAIAPALFANLTYDVIKDFAPVAITAAVPHLVTVHPSIQVSSLKDLIAYLKGKPDLTYPSAGNGSMPHLAGEIFKSLAGVKLEHIPYKGTGQSKPALLGGQVELITDTLGSSLGDHKSGRLRILAIAANRRSALLPEVPTVDEALGTRGFEAVLWNVVAAPAGTPAPVLDALARATHTAMSDASLRESLANLGIEPQTGSAPAAATAYIRSEMARWKPVIDGLGIKLQ